MSHDGPLTHAGGVVYRERDGAPEYLVLRSSDDRHWVLPKGHIEPGERPEEAALREVREEAGIGATVVKTVGIWRFVQGRETVRVRYFLARAAGRESEGEGRAVRWCELTEALRLLDLPEAREVLRHAAALAPDPTVSPDAPDARGRGEK